MAQLRQSSRYTPDVDLDGQPWKTDHSESFILTYEEKEYYCSFAYSPNDEWIIAFGRSSGDGCLRVFHSLRNRTVQATYIVPKVTESVIANNGTAALAGRSSSDSLGGFLDVRNSSGEQLLTDDYDSNPFSVDMTRGGDYVALTTLPPSNELHLYNVSEGSQLLTHGIEDGTRQGVVATTADDEIRLHLIDHTNGRVRYVIDQNGSYLWTDDFFRPGNSLFAWLKSLFK